MTRRPQPGDDTVPRSGDRPTPGRLATGLASDPAFTGTYAPASVALVVGDGVTVDTAAVQTALDRTGRVVIPYVGAGVVLVDAPLIIKSNTRLEVDPRVTIKLKSGTNQNFLRNAAYTPLRSVSDAAITSASTTLTSATGAFTSADVGRAVNVAGAGANGGPLTTTIAAVTNGTTVTVALAAATTVTGATATVTTQDSNITVTGGKWDYNHAGNSGAAGVQAFSFNFSNVSRLVVRDVVVTGALKYNVRLINAFDFLIENVDHLVSPSDGVHVQGPAARGTIRNIRGTTGDDLVAFTASDYGQYNTHQGDITDMVVDGVYPVAANEAIKITGGAGLKLRRITIQNVYGSCSQFAIAAADDIGGGLTSSDQSDITIRNVAVTPGASYQMINIGPGAGGVFNLEGLNYGGTSGAGVLTVSGTVDQLTIGGLAATGGLTGGNLITVSGVINDLTLNKIRAKFGAANTASNLLNFSGTGSVARLAMSDVHMQYGGSAVYTATGTPALIAQIDNSYFKSNQYVVFAQNTAGVTYAPSNVTYDSLGQAGIWVQASSFANVYGGSITKIGGGAGANRSASQALNIFNINYPCALQVVSVVAGGMATNTNAGTAPFMTGPVTCDGSVWLPTRGYVRQGTATLVAGTVTVADTRITASSRIRLTTLTPGGTVGHVYVQTLTASTSFTMTSTSGADTSVIYYEVVTY